VANKSVRSQRRWKKATAGQTTLTAFNFTGSAPRKRERRASTRDNTEIPQTPPVDDVPIRQESVEVQIPPSPTPSPRQDVTDLPPSPPNLAPPPETDTRMLSDGEAMDWENELHEQTDDVPSVDISGWDVLRTQIDKDLKKGKKTLPVSQLRKLLLIRNFATLRLKGFKRIEASQQIALQWHSGEGAHFARQIRKLARHYQIFEQLPQEKRGGARSGRTLLLDERIRNAALEWLTALPAGQVTPLHFQKALNAVILPSQSISLKRPLSERTARRWLLRLGWRLKTLRKGVYMDGHERPDVVEYRTKIFLPAMEKYERRMARYEYVSKSEPLKRVPPNLKGEKEIVINFQDESCFTVNEYKSRAW
jgi:hypothetical protein